MSKYDFSKITTDELLQSVEHYNDEEGNHACKDISCGDCPLNGEGVCTHLNNSIINNLFKEELNRRLEMKQYKEITKDMTIDEFMSLDLNQIEYLSANVWYKTEAKREIILRNICEGGLTYRYILKPKPEVVLTDEIFYALLKVVGNTKADLERIYSCNITLIEEDSE